MTRTIETITFVFTDSINKETRGVATFDEKGIQLALDQNYFHPYPAVELAWQSQMISNFMLDAIADQTTYPVRENQEWNLVMTATFAEKVVDNAVTLPEGVSFDDRESLVELRNKLMRERQNIEGSMSYLHGGSRERVATLTQQIDALTKVMRPMFAKEVN